MKSIIIYNTKEHTQAPGNNDFRPLLKLQIISVSGKDMFLYLFFKDESDDELRREDGREFHM